MDSKLANELDVARQNHYVTARRNAHGRVLAEHWYRECEKARIPFGRLRILQTQAAVTIDMEPTGKGLSEFAVRSLSNELTPDCQCIGYGIHGMSFVAPVEVAKSLLSKMMEMILDVELGRV